jgi:hypothetical protein
MKTKLVEQGNYIIGCNYWASHAGTRMWSEWKPEIVENDLKLLSEMGIKVLRAFPLWPDFQPIVLHAGCMNEPREYRLGETPLPDTEGGRAGVSEEMMNRFADFVQMAEKYHLKLIASLITGWMSGRLFVPPAIINRNIMTDPVAIMWQVRFVKYFVKRFKNEKTIIVWEPGNECNCMGRVNREEAWVWSSAITDAIHSVDADRPILSGMHSLEMKRESSWTIQDQAELMDMLTTHPYPLFTPYCDREALNTIRSCLHATAESCLYADIGAKPCLIEEIGTLGPMIANETVMSDYVRTVLFSSWAHDCHGFVWWCGFDQTHLAHTPYDWGAVERELGLFRQNKEPKPVAFELKKFGEFLQMLPFDVLPPRVIDGVCILTEGQDQWASAFGSFILAKQSGLEIEFQYADQSLKSAELYLLPSVAGCTSISRRRMSELLDRVKEGATLYVSVSDALLSPFEEFTGLSVQTRQYRSASSEAVFEGNMTLPILGNVKLALTPVRARVLAREADGNPVFTCAEYGKGQVYFLSFPVEESLVKSAGSFYGPEAKPYGSIYKTFGQSIILQHAITKSASTAKMNPQVGVTEHPLDANKRVVVMINYSPIATEFTLSLSQGWQLERVLYGRMEQDMFKLSANDAAVAIIRQ